MTLIEWGKNIQDLPAEAHWWGTRRKRKRIIEIRNLQNRKMGVSLLIVIAPVAVHPKYGGGRYAYGKDRSNWATKVTMSMNGTASVTSDLMVELSEVIREGEQEALGLLQIWQLEGKPQFYFKRA